MTVTVFGKPDAECRACKVTRDKLDQGKVEYTKVDLTQDPQALEFIKSRKHLAAPVVLVENENNEIVEEWSGLRLDKIRDLITTTTTAIA